MQSALKEMGLKLNEDKTRITNINEDKILFLGTHIRRAKRRTYSKVKKTSAIKRNPLRLRLEAPLERVDKKLQEAQFLREDKPHPKFV